MKSFVFLFLNFFFLQLRVHSKKKEDLSIRLSPFVPFEGHIVILSNEIYHRNESVRSKVFNCQLRHFHLPLIRQSVVLKLYRFIQVILI